MLNVHSSVEEILDAISKLPVEWNMDSGGFIRAKNTERCPICEVLDYTESKEDWRGAVMDTFGVKYSHPSLTTWRAIVAAADNSYSLIRDALVEACRLHPKMHP